MAFDSLPGMRITVSQHPKSYIIGDYFSVFDSASDIPEVYEWSSVKSYIETSDGFTITLINGNVYKLTKNCFTDSAQIILFRSIVEGQLAGCGNTTKKVHRRILPPKYNYRNTGISGNVFSATGIYTERDINSGSLAKVYSRFAWLIWLSALVATGLALLFSMTNYDDVQENLFYYICLSVFWGIGVAVVTYLICCMKARYRYAEYVRSDVSTTENIVFIVASDGFAATEECVYTGKDIIPWSLAQSYFETKYSVVITLKDNSICRIPRRLFDKKVWDEMVIFISNNLIHN